MEPALGELLDAAAEYLQEAEAPGGEFCARVYKVGMTLLWGKAAYVRLFSGSLKKPPGGPLRGGDGGKGHQDPLCLREEVGGCGTGGGERYRRALRAFFRAVRRRAGHSAGRELREYRLREPLMLAKAEPENPEQQRKLVEALQLLCEEDPSLQLEWNREKQEAWIRVTGRIQLEVLEGGC